MRVTVNGEEREVAEDATVGSIVSEGGWPIKSIAVELDGAIVRKDAYDQTPLHEGAVIEVVLFVGGG